MSIPNRIILTYKTDKIELFPEKYKMCYTEIKKYFGNNFEIKIYIDSEMDNIVKNYSKDLYEIYKKQHIIVKTDIFRLVALYVLGGYYMDMDIFWIKSPDKLLENIKKENKEIVFCVEKKGLQQNNYFFKNKNITSQISNYFIASKKNSPILKIFIDNLFNTLNENTKLILSKWTPCHMLLLINRNNILNNVLISKEQIDNQHVYKIADVLMRSGPLFITNIYTELDKKITDNIQIIPSENNDMVGNWAKHLYSGLGWKN